MFNEITVVIAILAIGAFGWWFYRKRVAAARRGDEDQDESVRHDHARAYETAKAQAELQRWSGPH